MDLGSDAYIERVLDAELDELLASLPAVSIEGPKWVGKTVTASRRAQTRFDLDRPSTKEVIQADPNRLTQGAEPILIDEWQRFPASWDLIRRAVDTNRRPGRFLLTGSTSPESPATHTGAGRIVTVQMRPLTMFERGVERPTVSIAELLTGRRPTIGGATAIDLARYTEEIVRGGFPGMQTATGRAQRADLDGYLRRIVDRDFPDAGRRVRNPAALRGWLQAYAAATSTTASYETIRDAATPGHADKPAKTTTGPYRDTLTRLWIIDPIQAWSATRNHLAKLTATPKHHLADPALAARLLGVGAEALLAGDGGGQQIPRDGTLLGALFESLVTLDVRVFAQAAEAQVRHLRTSGGEREIDLIVVRDDQRVVAIEVKLSATVSDNDVRHLRWLADALGPDLLDAVVITTGTDAYRRTDGIAVVPAALLGP